MFHIDHKSIKSFILNGIHKLKSNFIIYYIIAGQNINITKIKKCK